MRRIVLTLASYTSRSLIASAQRCVNLYAEINPADAAAPVTFYGTPGRKLWSTLPTKPVRGMWKASNGVLFAVGGSRLYRYNAGAWIDLAGLASASGPVYAADNGISAVFVDGTATAPTVNVTSFVTGAMGGDGWHGSDFVDFLDGFFIFNKPNSQQFYITGAYDLTVDALDFASSESQPDKLVRIFRDSTSEWMFGEKTTELFANGGGMFPFERVGGAVIDVGCAAPHSVAKMDNAVVWLAGGSYGAGMIVRAENQQPVPISTRALEEEMRTYGDLSDAIAYGYQQGGHWFYVITFPRANKSWAFDASTQLWAERAYRTAANRLERVRDNCHVFFDNKHLVGDWETGAIYELDLDTYTDNGAAIPRIKSFQHMTADGARQFFSRMVLDMQAGVGIGANDPQVSMRYSDDGGNTWSGLLTASIGKTGQYNSKPCFNRLGMGRDRVFEVSTTAAVRIALQGAFIEAQVGTS